MNENEEIQRIKYSIFKKRVIGNFITLAFIIPLLFILGTVVVIGMAKILSFVGQGIAICIWIVISAIIAIYFTKEE